MSYEETRQDPVGSLVGSHWDPARFSQTVDLKQNRSPLTAGTIDVANCAWTVLVTLAVVRSGLTGAVRSQSHLLMEVASVRKPLPRASLKEDGICGGW